MNYMQVVMHSMENPLQITMGRWRANAGFVFVAVLLTCLPAIVRAQDMRVGVGTNIMYWATCTPNIRADWHVKGHYTLSTTIGYNQFDFGNDYTRNTKVYNWVVYPEVKYWLCRPFERDYFGFHAFYGRYNASGLKFPSFLDDYRYRGYGLGLGFSYGYQWPIGKRWGLEASFGLGYIYLNYRKYELGKGGELLAKGKQHVFMPTKASLSVVYFIR